MAKANTALLNSPVIRSPEADGHAGAAAEGRQRRVKFLTWVYCLSELNKSSASMEDGKNRYLSGY